jgi:hypothetical protein
MNNAYYIRLVSIYSSSTRSDYVCRCYTSSTRGGVGSLLSIAKERGDAMANLGVRLKVLSGQLELNDIDTSIPVWNAAEFVKNVGDY